MIHREEIFGRRAAVILGGLLLLGFSVLAGFGMADRAQRAELERFEQPSAVGDATVFSFPGTGTAGVGTPESNTTQGGPDPSLPSGPVLSLGGKPQYVERLSEMRDWRMLKAGTDDSGKVTLFHWFNRDDRVETAFWLRYAPGRYALLTGKPRQSGTQ